MFFPEIIQIPARRRSLYIFCALFIFFIFWNWSRTFFFSDTGLDSGAVFTYSVVGNRADLSYGKNLIANNGPLYWLYYGDMVELVRPKMLLLKQVTGNILYALIKTCIVFFLYKHAKTKLDLKLTFAGFFLLLIDYNHLSTDFKLSDAGILLCTFLLYQFFNDMSSEETSWRGKYELIGIVFLVSILQYTKFSILALSWFIILMVGCLCIYFKKYIMLCFSIVGYLLLSVIVWVASGSDIGYIGVWLKLTLAMSTAYSEGLAAPFSSRIPLIIFCVAVICCMVYFITLIYYFIRDKQKAFFIFLAAPILFIAWKNSFVRADSHTRHWMPAFITVALYVLFIIKDNININMAGFEKKLTLFFVGSMVCYFLIYAGNTASTSTLKRDLDLYKDYHNQVEQNKVKLRDTYDIYESAYALIPKGASMAVIPYEHPSSLAYGYEKNYFVHPQTHNGYGSAAIDAYDAQVFKDDNAPEYIIYKYISFDNKYPAFADPAQFRTLLEEYEIIKSDHSAIVFKKVNRENDYEPTLIGKTTAHINEDIIVPHSDEGYVFAKVTWNQTFFGKIASFILRSSINYVVITTTDGDEFTWRYSSQMGQNGLFLSTYVSDNFDLTELLNGGNSQSIQSIRFEGSKLFFSNNIDIEYTTIPYSAFNTTNVHCETKTVEIAIHPYQSTRGSFELFYANDKAWTENSKERVEISIKSDSLITFRLPVSGWDGVRFDLPAVDGSYDIISITIDGERVSYMPDSVNGVEYRFDESGALHVDVLDPSDPFLELIISETN